MDYIDELQELDSVIEIYTESVIRELDTTEIRNESAGVIIEKTDDKSIGKKIIEAIQNIFKKLKSVLTKGKTQVKADLQQKTIDDLKQSATAISDVKITIQDVWKFYNGVNRVIDDFVKHPSQKSINTMNIVKGGKKGIKHLTDALNSLAKQMRSPSSRKFKIEKMSIPKLLLKMWGGIIGLSTSYGVITKPNDFKAKKIYRDTDKKAAELADAYGVSRDQLQSILDGDDIFDNNDRGIEFDSELGNLFDDEQNKLNKLSDFNMKAFEAYEKLIIPLEIAIIFTSLPKKTGTEDVTIGELYKRLAGLKASTVPSEISKDGDRMSTYLSRIDAMDTIQKNAEDGKRSSVKFAQEVSALLSAYTAFYQSLIDFYISIINDVIKFGRTARKGKIQAPKNMINTSAMTN